MGLAVTVWRVEVLGRIGKSRPAKAPNAGREHAEEFDDAILDGDNNGVPCEALCQ